MQGKVIIFSAPSGSGKSTIINWLMQEHKELNMAFSISCTSRQSHHLSYYLGYHLEDGKDVSAEAAALREKAEAAKKALEASGGSYDVGSKKFLAENGITDTEHLADGLTSKNLLYVARDKKMLGIIGIEDPIRPKMKKTLNQMRRYGIDEIVMLTGDSKAVAADVARSMDIDSYYAEILPEDKSNYVLIKNILIAGKQIFAGGINI